MRALRTLLVEIYPPNLAPAGLERGPRATCSRRCDARGRRDRASTSTDELALAREAEALVYRIAQEALRNVARARRAASA